MTIESLKEIFHAEPNQRIPITHSRVAKFETIRIELTPTNVMVLTYNPSNDQLKIQLGNTTELFKLATLELWLLRQRMLSLALEENVPLDTVEMLTNNQEGF